MDDIIDYNDLFEKKDNEFQEMLRLHDIENYELMGYDFSGSGKNKNNFAKIKKVKWIILPRGKHPFSEIIRYIGQLKKTKWLNNVVDENRIKTIYKLRSDKTEVIVGAEEFDGYFIFTFPEMKLFVLDCPLYGNAIYIIKGSWKKIKTLSKLSKGEIIKRYPNTIRIIHKGEWEKRLSNKLSK
jgi:hypothetical protein